jgi:hypothetical protein
MLFPELVELSVKLIILFLSQYYRICSFNPNFIGLIFFSDYFLNSKSFNRKVVRVFLWLSFFPKLPED